MEATNDGRGNLRLDSNIQMWSKFAKEADKEGWRPTS
jgi:hypothetical protein